MTAKEFVISKHPKAVVKSFNYITGEFYDVIIDGNYFTFSESASEYEAWKAAKHKIEYQQKPNN